MKKSISYPIKSLGLKYMPVYPVEFPPSSSTSSINAPWTKVKAYLEKRFLKTH